MNNKPRRLKYEQFYLKQGINYLSQLKNPPIHFYQDLVLPFNSVLHWVDYENQYDVGPNQTEPLLLRTSNHIVVEAISEYPANAMPGFFVNRINYNKLVSAYDTENRNITRLQKLVNQYTDVNVLLLYVYGLLDNSHRYNDKIDTELKTWHNYFYTVFNKAWQLSKQTNRHQFIELPVPTKFPTYNNFIKAEAGLNKNLVMSIPLPEQWLSVNIWNLIAQNGNSFIFQDYDVKDFDRINIIWRFDDKYTVMNLGVFLRFAHAEKNTIKPLDLQKSYVTLMARLVSVKELEETLTAEIRNNVDGFVESDDPKNVSVKFMERGEVDDNADEELIYTESGELNDHAREDERNRLLDKLKSADKANRNFAQSDQIVESEDDDVAPDQDVDAEFINVLDAIGEDGLEQVSAYTAYKPQENSAHRVILDEGSKLVKAGIMSVNELARYEKLVDRSYELDAPLEPGKAIKDFMTVSEDKLVIEDKNPIAVKSTDIVDQSMLSSSMAKYHEQYIKDVLQADIASAVMNIQKGGLVIKDYNVETVETLNDKYDIHKVQIETLRGHVSTLTFKVPHIETDGTFIANSNKRFMRKQRGDKSSYGTNKYYKV